ncbi:MAG: copper chaperone PCu(A)C [Rickettsiaceae bacterium]|nr:copper chaperone PCu(A)C [Rickettsiaceae bacterium]
MKLIYTLFFLIFSFSSYSHEKETHTEGGSSHHHHHKHESESHEDCCDHKDCEVGKKKTKKKRNKKDKNTGAEVSGKDLVLSSPWLRTPSAKARNTAAYVTIQNKSKKDMTIKGVEFDETLFKKVEIHGYKNEENEVKKMFKLESVTIPAESSLSLEPKSFHIMLMGIKKPINKGDDVKLDLIFAESGAKKDKVEKITVNFKAD